MARRRVLFLLLSPCLLSLQLPCCSGKPTVHDDSNPAQVSNPTMPITVPSTSPAPTIITVPSTNPTITIPSLNPLPTPITAPSINPSTTPVPVTYPLPSPSTSAPTAPVTNPVITPSTFPPSAPLTNPEINPITPAVSTPPPAPITAPVVSGQQAWCVVKSGSTETVLQNALDYACGIGGADCSPIQPSGSCYYPNTLEAHASYAFNSYYQRNPEPSSCDFGGTAMLVNANPSSGSCVLASSVSSPSSSTAGIISAEREWLRLFWIIGLWVGHPRSGQHRQWLAFNRPLLLVLDSFLLLACNGIHEWNVLKKGAAPDFFFVNGEIASDVKSWRVADLPSIVPLHVR